MKKMMLGLSILGLVVWTHWLKLSLLMTWLTIMLWLSYVWFVNFYLMSKGLVYSLGLVLMLFFNCSHVWWLIFLFELSLLPIVLIILGYGQQVNRLPASLYLLTYTLLFSLPSLYLLLSMVGHYNLLVQSYYYSAFLKVVLSLSFLVKLPIFGLHLWLGKAHIESPTLGSSILAGVLLKTGSYGLWMMSLWLKVFWYCFWFMLGSMIMAVITAIQVDLKKAVAYSSVMHLNLSLASFCLMINWGQSAFLLMGLTHGFISSTLFMLAGSSSTNSRLLFWLNQSTLVNWLLMMSFNLSLPPSPSFWSEFISFGTLLSYHLMILLPLVVAGIAMAWFTFTVWLNFKSQEVRLINLNYLLVVVSGYFMMIMWLNVVLFI